MTVDEVLVQANTKLDELGIRVPDGSRAGRYVDLRGFRFYRTQNLVDPPIEKQGVAGVYGQRHVCQLVAIKALQARWLPLHEVRRMLAHASDEKLSSMAVQPDLPATDPPAAQRRIRTDQGARQWVEFPLANGAYAMVSPTLLGSARPSAVRAMGERLVAQLLAERGQAHA